MPIDERLDSVEEVMQCRDVIPLHYEYTAGVAGEKFLRGLIEGKIIAGYCTKCKKASLPLRMYCLDCYSPIKREVVVHSSGKVVAMTTTRSGEEKVAYGYVVVFDGVRGGMLHRVIGSVRPGGRVEPRFRPKRERKGSILDIEGFEASQSR